MINDKSKLGLSREEFKEVTKAFYRRLDNMMSNAGCNDVCNDEFPKSVCEKFKYDFELLEVWLEKLESNYV